MYYNEVNRRVRSLNQVAEESERYLNTSDIYLPPGYKIEIFAEGLDTPTSILFTDEGEMYIADSGYITGNPKVSKLVNNQFEIIADGFNVPLIGITYRNGEIYVSHRATISVIQKDRQVRDIITGLPSFGDYSNSKVAFDIHNKMYFGLGTATNSGVVGTDNLWVKDYPMFHDFPGGYIMMNGQNFETINKLIDTADEPVLTGAFSPYGIPNNQYEVKKGVLRASGGVLRSDINGENMELVAWGLRSISYMKFDSGGRLFVSNNGFDIRGSRPIANAPDELHIISEGVWYGWPDYAGGEPVTLSRFQPEGGVQPKFLLLNHPNIPPRPYAIFPPNSTIIGFDINENTAFGQVGDIFITEFGSINPPTYVGASTQFLGVGHRISKIDQLSGSVTTFAINKSGFSAGLTGEGGFGRPADIGFGPDGAMYIVDMGTNLRENSNVFKPNTGVIWKISRV